MNENLAVNKETNISGDHFHYRNGVLHIEDIDYRDIISDIGTPVACFSRKRILDNLKEVGDSFRRHHDKVKVFFAYKANYCLPILCDLGKDAGAEVISRAELDLAKKVGIKNEDIIFNGVGKTDSDLEFCASEGILVNADSLSEIETYGNIAESHGKDVDIGLRIHPKLGKMEDVAFIKRGSKLGLDPDSDAKNAIRLISEKNNLRLAGLHSHAYSRQSTPEMHLKAVDTMIEFSEYVRRELGYNPVYFDIGGGLGTRSVMEKEHCLGRFAKEICDEIRSFDKEIYLYLELGRFIVNDSGIVLSRITRKKTNRGNTWLISDIATNYLIPLPSAEYKVIPAEIRSRPNECVNIGGGICSSSDVIETGACLPSIEEGEYIAILNTGAYTNVMVSSFVYSKPNILYVDGSVADLIGWGLEKERRMSRRQT